MFQAKKYGELMFVDQIDKGQTLTHDVVPEGGLELELFVLSGSFTDHGGVQVDSKIQTEAAALKYGHIWWLYEAWKTGRVASLVFYSEEGCTLIIKINHLPATVAVATAEQSNVERLRPMPSPPQ